MRHGHKKGRLYGIGLGPGDPELITLKARDILQRVDTIFVPKADEGGFSHARSMVEAVIEGEKDFRELIFPMTQDRCTLRRYWEKASQEIFKEIRKGKACAFVTIGDPFIYSTYIYLLKTLSQNYPGIISETIPGISAFNAAASRLQIPLAEGNEKLAILPVTEDMAGLRDAFKKFDTVVLMKVGSKLFRVIGLLKELRLIKKAVLVSHLGHRNEKIIRNLTSLKDRKAGYLSVVIVKK